MKQTADLEKERKRAAYDLLKQKMNGAHDVLYGLESKMKADTSKRNYIDPYSE